MFHHLIRALRSLIDEHGDDNAFYTHDLAGAGADVESVRWLGRELQDPAFRRGFTFWIHTPIEATRTADGWRFDVGRRREPCAPRRSCARSS